MREMIVDHGRENTIGIYSVNFAYKALFSLRVERQEEDILHIIWKFKIPPKVAYFIWRVRVC